MIGLLTTVDANALDKHSYSLAGVDAAHFKVEGNRLVSASYFDYELRWFYEVELTSVDGTGAAITAVFIIRVTDGNQVVSGGEGSEDVDSVSVDSNSAVGQVEDDLATFPIHIYPNPSSGLLRIGGLAGVEKLEVRVLSLTGAVVAVYGRALDAYDLGHLAKGLYIVVVEADGKVSRHKVILR